MLLSRNAVIVRGAEPQTGDVIGQTTERHTSQKFVTFLEEVVATTRPTDASVYASFSTSRQCTQD